MNEPRNLLLTAALLAGLTGPAGATTDAAPADSPPRQPVFSQGSAKCL